MPLVLPRFYAIIEPAIRPALPLRELGRVLAGAGVRLIQLRSKQSASRDFLADASALLQALPSTSKLIVNDRVDVAVLAGAAGVHVGQDDLPAAAARALLGPEGIVGLSTHSQTQVEAAESAPVDYLAFGPLFATATKTDHEPVVGCAQLREARRRTTKPLVAIGGITPATAAQVIEAGADSVAVIGGWLAAEDVSQRLEEFRRVLGRLD